MNAFRKGQRVAIINQTLGGRFVLEGFATLQQRMDRAGTCWNVRFEGDSGIYQRFVDPAAQSNPVAFVASLNQQTGAA